MTAGCRDIERWSSAYLDDELDEARREALRGHLRQCAPCRALVADLAAIVDAASQLPEVELPASMGWSNIERVLGRAEDRDASARAEERDASARPRRAWAVPVAAAAGMALAAALFIGFYAWRAAAPGDGPGDGLAARVDSSAASSPATAALSNDEQVQDIEATAVQTDIESLQEVVDPAHRHFLARALGLLDATDEVRPLPGPSDERWREERARSVKEADQRYQSTIRELRDLVAEERSHWPDDVSAAFDERLGHFDAAATRHQLALAERAAAHDTRARDALYDVYQAEIAFLQEAALSGPPMLGGRQ